jgi:hypothetical protein
MNPIGIMQKQLSRRVNGTTDIFRAASSGHTEFSGGDKTANISKRASPPEGE